MLHLLFVEKAFLVCVDILIRQIVGVAFTKAVATAGGSVLLTSGKKTGISNLLECFEVKKEEMLSIPAN